MEQEIKINWVKCIGEEIGDQALCQTCRRICEAKEPGEHIYCQDCKIYLWREDGSLN